MKKLPQLPLKLWEGEVESYFKIDDGFKQRLRARVVLDSQGESIFEILTRDSLAGECWCITNDVRTIKHIVGHIAMEQYNNQFSDLSHPNPKVVFNLLSKMSNEEME